MSEVSLCILRKAAELCVESYLDTPHIGTRHTCHNASVLLHEDGDTLWIVPRGTDDLSDLFDDLNCQRHPFWNFNIHKGFFEYAYNVWQAIGDLKVYQNAVNRNKDIYISGHSLGGSAAIILPLIDPALGSKARIRNIITFGCPRSFNGGTNPIRHPTYGRIIRINRVMDIVPEVPLWHNIRSPIAMPLSGWSHIGNSMYLYPGKLSQEGPSRILNWGIRSMRYLAHLPLHLVRRIWCAVTKKDRPHTLLEQDHSMSNYLTEISSL